MPSCARHSAAIFAAIFFVLTQNMMADAAAPQIWFKMANYKGTQGVDGPQGWRKLFSDPNASWPGFMDHVQVVAAAGIMQVPVDVLAKMFVKLKQKHIAFAIESLAQSWVNQPACGQGGRELL